MFSAQAIARSDENRAKQITATLGRMALTYMSKGVSSAATTASDAAKVAREQAKKAREQAKMSGNV